MPLGGRGSRTLSWDIRGETLWRYWQHASEESRESLRNQLKHLICELREVPNPVPGRVAGAGGGVIIDDRYTEGRSKPNVPYFGPFSSVRDFHLWLRCGLELPVQEGPGIGPSQKAELEEMIKAQDERDYSTILTHGDLNSFNIIVRDDKIVGIVDWESAAFYPDYWELTSTLNVNVYDEVWKPEIEKILDLPRFSKEYRMEQIRRKYFQDWD